MYTTDTRRFRPMRDNTFRELQMRLKYVAEHQPGALAAKEQLLGFRYNPHSWLQDETLNVRAMRILAFDWMHCWCEKGVWELEFGACMDVLHRHGHGSQRLHEYLQNSRGQKLMQVAAMFARAVYRNDQDKQQMFARLDQPQKC